MEKHLRKIVKCLYASYTERHGKTIGKLSEHSLFILDHRLKEAVPELFDEKDTNLESVKEAFQELRHRGFVDVLGNNREIRLTSEGYKWASENVFQKSLNFLNKNSGVAILVFVISLIVSIVALFKNAK